MVNDMVFTKCGFSIDHGNQNTFLKWRKQETKDESAYSLHLMSEFSYKVHCKAGILPLNVNQKAQVLESYQTWRALTYCFSLSSGDCRYLWLRTIRKKNRPKGQRLYSASPFHLITSLRRSPYSPSLEWHMCRHTQKLRAFNPLFFPNSIWTSFTFSATTLLLAGLSQLPKTTFYCVSGRLR